jgi:iron-sulfur cluster assembly protein
MRPIGEATLEVPRRSPSPPTPAREEKAQTSKRDVAAAPSAPSTPAATQASPTPSPSIPPTDTPPLAKAAAPAPAPAPKPRSKLRTPRKAAIKLTPSAVEQLRALLDQPSPKLIKVGVRNRGCSGLSYSLEFVDKAGKFDETVEQDGVQVLIDSKALFSIIGSEMDWVEDKLSQKFVFRNPNISELPERVGRSREHDS